MSIEGQIALGQCFVGKTLYYTTPAPAGKDGLWVCSTNGLEEFDVLIERHPEAVSADTLELLEIQKKKSANLAARARVRWSVAARGDFLAGRRDLSAKELYQRLRDFICRHHWSPNSEGYDLLATFLMATYLYTVANSVPNIHLVGDPGSGKTRVAEIAEQCGFKPVLASDATPAALFRHLSLIRALVILDEQEGVNNPRLNRMVRAGYRSTGNALRCEGRIPMTYSCFSPKIVVTNSELTDQALETRFIPYKCERAPQPVENLLDRLTSAEVVEIQDALHIFGLMAAPDVAARYANHPHIEGVSNRDEEIAGLLWAVASYIDEQPGPELGVHGILVTLMQTLSETRRRGREFDGEKSVLKLIVQNFLVEHAKDQVDGYPGYFIGDAFVKYANGCRELEHPIPSTKVASEKLRRHDLLADKKRVRIRAEGAGHIPGMPATVDYRIQRTAFKFTDALSLNSNT